MVAWAGNGNLLNNPYFVGFARAQGRPTLFHLATACQEESILDEAKATLEELVRRYPESCWSDQARRSLASLTMLDLGSE